MYPASADVCLPALIRRHPALPSHQEAQWPHELSTVARCATSTTQPNRTNPNRTSTRPTRRKSKTSRNRARKKAAKTKAPAKPRARKKAVKVPERTFARWAVCDNAAKRVAVFEYKDRAGADAKLAEVREWKAGTFFIVLVKDPYDPLTEPAVPAPST